MKHILYIILTVLCVCPLSVAGQDLDRIMEVSSSIRTLQCGFRQTKYIEAIGSGMESEGYMVYDSGGSLRWEYISPIEFAVVISGGKVTMRSGDGQVSRAPADNMFRRISELLAETVSGRCLAPDGDFDCGSLIRDGMTVAELTPKDRDLRRVISRVTLYFDRSTCLLRYLEMEEKNGDRTRIDIYGARLNEALGTDVFELR